MPRLIFLGTSAALPQLTRANTALALVDDETGSGLQIDCGGDPYRAQLAAGIGPDTITDLFITHAHIDHIGGLPSLIESLRLGGRSRPLRVLAIPPVLAVARALVAAYDFELTLDAWGFQVTFQEVQPGEAATLAGWPARVVSMDHSVPSSGVRLMLPGGDLAYTCDTQPTPRIVELGKGTHLLVTECTYLQAYTPAARISKHLTAVEAGQAAAACAAQQLALVHLGPWPADAIREEAGSVFSGEILIPNDGDAIAV
ncbi:MAG TPA: ribonuclease Z [Ktedonobacterales bacterium]|nr:ribonuclease Z [Ktedonobacterales bacterium]